MVKTRNDPRDSNDASGSEEQTDGAHVSGCIWAADHLHRPKTQQVTQMMTNG
jgi:hypothetical protein